VLRASLLVAVVMAACSSPSHAPVDSRQTDAPIDSPAGSGSHAAFGSIEPSPVDHNLELGVVAASLVVAMSPIRSRRRRKAL
jgi:hypothetical protein